MAEEYYDEDDAPESQGRDHLFLWTVFILLLIGAAFACWIGSFYVFGHPEKPRPYKILMKLKKLEAPKRFELTQAPTGEFLNPAKLFERYGNMKSLELQQENDSLLRNFIKNYRETKKLVPYVTGRFEVVSAHELTKDDMFGSGVVVLAVSDENPQVLLEQVFTTSPAYVATCKAALPVGRVLRIERTKDLAALVHVERTSTGHLQFTTMPIAYAGWRVTNSPVIISLEPPTELNVGAGLPIIRGDRLAAGIEQFAQLVRTRPVKPASEEGEKKEQTEPELVRLDVKPGTTIPETGAMPDAPRPAGGLAANNPAAPTPAPGRVPPLTNPKKATPAATPIIVASNTTPAPRALGTPMPVATPVSVATPLPKRGPGGVQLQPFFIAAGPPTPDAPGGNWKTYAPGRQPTGKVVTAGEAGELAERGELVGGRVYLRGNFVVTASSEGRAVLRAQGSKTEAGNARVMVEFPPSVMPPAENSTFSRDDTRPFEVRDVRRGTDGILTLYVREVTVPQAQ